MHLWEIKHDYYCNEVNYYSNECTIYFETWDCFLSEFGDADQSMNMIFRWDWEECSLEDYEEEEEVVSSYGREKFSEPYDGNDDYRNGLLHLCYMMQRKGIYTSIYVKVSRNDEPKVRKFLEQHWNYLKEIWEPISNNKEI